VIPAFLTLTVISILLVGLLFNSFSASRNCNSDAPIADNIRKLSKDELRNIYSELETLKEKYKGSARNNKNIIFKLDYDKSPEALRLFKFKNLRVKRFYSRFMLQGCFDNFLTLKIEGLFGDRTPKLLLSSGEQNVPDEILWEK